MERKEVSVILVDDFEDFLHQNKLYDKYKSGQLFCDKCGIPITHDNIAAIYFDKEYKFCCASSICLSNI
jgi:hypothetical protein